MNKEKNQGFALITIMFVISVVAIIIISLQSKQQQAVRRSSMMVSRAQSYEQLRGAEDYASIIMTNTFTQTPNLIHPGQLWGRVNQFPATGANISVEIRDMQAFFNVNTMMGGNVTATTQFSAMCKYFSVADGTCEAIITEFKGRQININSDEQPVLEDIHTLATLPGVEAGEYAKLKPYIVAIKDYKCTINANTAPRKLLKSLLPENIYKSLDKQLSAGGFIDKNNIDKLGLTGFGLAGGSNNFIVRAYIEGNRKKLTMESFLNNASIDGIAPQVKILSREFIHGY